MSSAVSLPARLIPSIAALALLALALLAMPGAAAAEAPGAAETAQPFDIGARDLGPALRELGTETSLNLLYENGVVAGRRSAPVQGTMPRAAALAAMLQGTGLLYRFTGPDAAVVFPPDRLPTETAPQPTAGGVARMMLGLLPVEARPTIGGGGAGDFAPYGQAVQAAIDRRLQADPAIRGRRFRAVLRVTVDAEGSAHLASLAKPTGDSALDRSIALAVNGAAAPSGPPTGMPQPIWFELTNQR